jgi:pilus assembly protein CpaC
VAQTTGGGTAITLEEKPFGVGLDFTPTVLGDGRINLNVDLVVSELSAQGVTITSTNTGGTQILPAMTQRRAKTTVQLMDGQSFAIGGLIKNNVTTNLTAFPFLGELPIIGALFRSTSFQNDRSELVFVVTPRLGKPWPPDYALPTDGYVPPTRSDMILGGRLEGRKDDVPPPPAIPAEPAPAVPQSGGFEVK